LNDFIPCEGTGPFGEGGIFSLELERALGSLEVKGDLVVTGKTGSLIVS
jgi:hypothetical protein